MTQSCPRPLLLSPREVENARDRRHPDSEGTDIHSLYRIERWVMAHQDRISFVQTFSFVVGCLLLLTLTNTGVALAQTPVPLLNQPLVPDVATPVGSRSTLTVHGTGS